MIKIENGEVVGWGHAIRGMRNPLNSWPRMDSDKPPCLCCPRDGVEPYEEHDVTVLPYVLGENDHSLMMRLAKAGPEHAKYRRMIVVYADVTAPLYWWKEFDTYKVGTVANSCSTMHKIADKEFTLEDFSHERLITREQPLYEGTRDCIEPPNAIWLMHRTVQTLNQYRNLYLQTKDKKYWWQIIQMLPSSYNQKRTIMLNYEVLANIYRQRKGHKLDEWREFCGWVEQLPYSELITEKEAETNE